MSSSDLAISVRELSKAYIIAHKANRSTTLAEALLHRLRDPLDRTKKETFWALDDVNFDIYKGDVVGVVGRNGAGKSTLLKILSRITEPTRGQVDLFGRVGSLLEVGTGFHPELTGRENIYLNGAILGMRRSEITQQFDAIVNFAEVENFLDTPVKRYSSGMYVRLAFAVAAHLNPEILIVDEVLAVGDMQFQKKCIGKMQDVAGQGRTVLFVSHNMSAIAQLCQSGIFLNSGKVLLQAGIDAIVSRYLSSGSREGDIGRKDLAANAEKLRLTKRLFFTSVSLLNQEEETSTDLDVRFPFTVQMEFEIPQPLYRLELSVRILTSDGRPVLTSLRSETVPDAIEKCEHGCYRASVTFPGMFLMPGNYLVNVAAHEPVGEIFDLHESALAFSVRDTGTVFARYQHYSAIGIVMQSLPWSQETINTPITVEPQKERLMR